MMFMATWERRRSAARPRWGEELPRLLAEERRERSAAFMLAAAAREVDDARGEGVSRRGAGGMGVALVCCAGEEDIGDDEEGGRELRSGGIGHVNMQILNWFPPDTGLVWGGAKGKKGARGVTRVYDEGGFFSDGVRTEGGIGSVNPRRGEMRAGRQAATRKAECWPWQ